jgi:predicted DCC family thiol-disulfide oxidoreductase YuxK
MLAAASGPPGQPRRPYRAGDAADDDADAPTTDRAPTDRAQPHGARTAPADADAALSASPSAPIVLYDGQCGLCHRSVRWLLRRDGGRLRYAPLQGPTAAELRRRFPQIPMTLESVVLIDEERAWLRSRAFLHAARYLDRPWRWAYALRWLPAAILDPLYRVIARYRYRWFGHYDECRLPSEPDRRRFLP